MSHAYAFPPERLGTSNAGSFVPLYVQLADRISRLIRQQGESAVGKALPSEAQCAEAFAVSRPTVRQAMDRLLSQGLIKREKGRGTFVTRPRLAHDVTHDFDDEMRLATRRVTYKVLSWGTVEAPPHALAAFGPSGARDLYLLRRVRSVDGEIVGVEERFVPADLASRFAEERLGLDSIFELVRQAASEPIARIDVEVSGKVADAESARLMGLARGAALLVRTSTFRGPGGRALVHSTTSFAAEHYTFRFAVNFSGAVDAAAPGQQRKSSTKRSS